MALAFPLWIPCPLHSWSSWVLLRALVLITASLSKWQCHAAHWGLTGWNAGLGRILLTHSYKASWLGYILRTLWLSFSLPYPPDHFSNLWTLHIPWGLRDIRVTSSSAALKTTFSQAWSMPQASIFIFLVVTKSPLFDQTIIRLLWALPQTKLSPCRANLVIAKNSA